MKKLFTFFAIAALMLSSCTHTIIFDKEPVTTPEDDELVIPEGATVIYYTTTDGKAIQASATKIANILSNTYKNDEGVLIIDGTLTEIPNEAFYNFRTIKSITIPESVTIIGKSAYSGCDNITEITIPKNVTSIGADAFSCKHMETVYCKPTTPPTISRDIFFSSSNNLKIYVPISYLAVYKVFGEWKKYADCIIADPSTTPEGIVTPPNNEIWYIPADGKTITLQAGIEAFGANITYNGYRDGKWVIQFDGDVTFIGRNNAFYGSNLVSITLPNSVIEIADFAFSECQNLASATISNNITKIGANIFSYCKNLAEIKGKFASEDGRCLIIDGVLNSFAPAGLSSYTIPDGVTKIGDYAFEFCSGLTSITIPDSVTEIGERAFAQCIGLTSITIPNSITKIERYAFSNCNSLTSITIPDSVAEIGDYAFDNCDNLAEFKGKFASTDGRCLIIDGVLKSFAPAGLTEYTIPDGVCVIGGFSSCDNLVSVTIPDSVTEIRCSFGDNLKTAYLEPVIPPTITYYPFNSNTTIYVYPEIVELYKNMWNSYGYADKFVSNGKSITDTTTIIYTTTDDTIIDDWNNMIMITGVNPPIKSNTYSDGIGTLILYGKLRAIPKYLFYGCKKLKRVIIPDHIVDIEEAAFSDCTNLISVTIPLGVEEIGVGAFGDCKKLASIEIPNSVTTIGGQAFTNCVGLTSITIPDSVTEISLNPFAACIGLTEFKGKYASTDGRCLVVDGVLNSFAPAGLSSYTIPDGVTKIGDYAFDNCSGLTSITIENGVTSIGDYAFDNCSGLTSVTIENGVTSIGDYAFLGSGLTSITIPDSVTEIGDFAFAGCNGLTSTTIGNSVTAWSGAFAECYNLTNVTIKSGVTTIGHYAFCYCSSLTNITIPNSVTEIGYEAFAGSGLISITIPKSVTTICPLAFTECNKLSDVYCRASTPPTILLDSNSNNVQGVFENNAVGRKIYVPRASVDAYKAADGWKDYADAIEPYDF